MRSCQAGVAGKYGSAWRFPLTFTEEAGSGSIVERQLRAAEQMIGHARQVFRDQWQGSLTASGSFGGLFLENSAKPTGRGAATLIIRVVLFGVKMPGRIPVGIAQQ